MKRAQSVYGHTVPPCRITREALFLVLFRFGLPVSLGFLALDLVIWAAIKFFFSRCYGLWCYL